MEQKSSSSFIPKSVGPKTLRARKPFSLFIWLVSFLFIASVFSSVVMFFYERFLLSQHEAKKEAIQNEIRAFEPELTRELTAIKNRVDSGQKLLQSHISASSFFLLLESLTVRNVFFSELSLNTSSDSWPTIQAKGEAPSYAVLAFQSNSLKGSDVIRNVKFGDVNLNEKGTVGFSLEMEVDPRLVLYSALFPRLEDSSSETQSEVESEELILETESESAE